MIEIFDGRRNNCGNIGGVEVRRRRIFRIVDGGGGCGCGSWCTGGAVVVVVVVIVGLRNRSKIGIACDIGGPGRRDFHCVIRMGSKRQRRIIVVKIPTQLGGIYHGHIGIFSWDVQRNSKPKQRV